MDLWRFALYKREFKEVDRYYNFWFWSYLLLQHQTALNRRVLSVLVGALLWLFRRSVYFGAYLSNRENGLPDIDLEKSVFGVCDCVVVLFRGHVYRKAPGSLPNTISIWFRILMLRIRNHLGPNNAIFLNTCLAFFGLPSGQRFEEISPGVHYIWCFQWLYWLGKCIL